ncbi:MAG: AAA family ATPase [Limnochordia bacterium]
MDFNCNLCIGLGLAPKNKKVNMFHSLRDHIVNLICHKSQTPFIILDEGQFLGGAILNELRMLFNFQMDS